MLGTLAEAGFTVHLFDADNGWETLLKLSPAARKNIRLYRLPDTKANPCAIQSMMKIIRGTRFTLCHAHGKAGVQPCAECSKNGAPIAEIELNKLGPKDIVAIDTGTGLGMSAINHTTLGQPDEYQMQKQDWGNVARLLDAIFSYIRGGKFHTVVLAHEMHDTDEKTKVTRTLPQIGTGPYSDKVGGYFSHIVHVEIVNKRHTGASSTTFKLNMLTGSRTDVAIEKEAELTLLPFFAPWL